MDPATVTIQLKPDDMRNFSKFIADKTKKRTWVVFLILVLFFMGIYAGKIASNPLSRPSAVPVHQGPPTLPWYGWFFVVLGPGLMVASRFLTRRLAGHPSLYKKTSPAVFDPKTYTVLDKGLRCQYELGESMDHWPAIVRFVETPDYFFIMVAERRGHVLPKRCFATAEEAAIFANQVRQHLTLQAPKASAGAVR